MSKGIGKVQAGILRVIRTRTSPVMLGDIVRGVWFLDWSHQSNARIPVAFYESVRRAAVGLARRGKLYRGEPAKNRRPFGSRYPGKLLFWVNPITPQSQNSPNT